MHGIAEPNQAAQFLGDEEILFLGLPTWIRANRQRTDGRLSLVEQVIPAGFESPWHIHHSEDESFYVMEGTISVIVGDHDKVSISQGGCAFGPRAVAHGFRVEGDRPARILLITSGGDFADFIAETSAPTSAPPSPPDMAKLVAAAARHQIEILGPMPR